MLADIAAQAAHILCQLGVCPTEVRLRQEQVGALLASPPARACNAPRIKSHKGMESTAVVWGMGTQPGSHPAVQLQQAFAEPHPSCLPDRLIPCTTQMRMLVCS